MLSVRARRLVLFLAALTAVVLTGCAGVTTTSGPAGGGVQNRVWAFTPAAQLLAPPTTSRSSCSRPGSVISRPEIVAAFCVATEDAAGGFAPIAGGSGPISMDDAIGDAVQHAGDNGVLEETGNGLNYQFRGTSTNANGDLVQNIGRLDVNPLDSHVATNGPHLNLETQINGSIVSNVHVPIDPTTIRPGDVP
jgi:hypothetical protein